MSDKSAKLNPLKLLFRSQMGPLVALLVIVFCIAAADQVWGSGAFLTFRNLIKMSDTASLIAVPAVGMTLIIIAGGIDLSAGTAMALCGTVLATRLKMGEVSSGEDGFALMVTSALAITLLVGAVCGLLNGTLVTTTKVVPFIVTLGTMSIFLGIGQIISNESTVRPPADHLPEWLNTLRSTSSRADRYGLIPFVPTSAIIAVLLVIGTEVMLRFTVFGRNAYAIGSNASTARLCGVNVPLNTLAVYTLAGLIIGIGGMVHFAGVKEGNPIEGMGAELEMIAAVVLGGGSLTGGRGSAIGTLIGAFIIVVIRSGCSLLDISDTWTKITIGAIIIIAVIVDQLRYGSPEWLFRMFSKFESKT